VLFVGDGINDSPVLAQSDVGCAINSASEVTVGAAGIVLINDSLFDVLRAIMIAGKTFQRIKINFLFAFLYNTILIPIAMGIFYPIDGFKLAPMFAATAMAMSSISVVTSSLFLKTYNPKFDTSSRKLDIDNQSSTTKDTETLLNESEPNLSTTN
jgi:Cu+-exporting ATPase